MPTAEYVVRVVAAYAGGRATGGRMETTRNVIIEFKLTKARALFFLAFFFLTWHPAFLGSEILTLTTYYPAPFGGYVSLLSTGSSYFARDGGGVAIRGSGVVDSLTVYGTGTAISTIDNPVRTRFFSAASTGKGYAGTLTSNDFVLRTSDQDRVTIAAATGNVNFSADISLSAGGTVRGICASYLFVPNGVSYCGGSPAASVNWTIVGYTDTNGNFPLFQPHDHVNRLTNNWLGQGFELQQGLLTCCRIR